MVPTEVVAISSDAPEPEAIQRAARILRQGGLVAFPTETVYGLGADALLPSAVERIFAVKGRPADNPLIVHIARPADLREIAREIPDCAARLIEAFWPGPLTLVLPKSPRVPLITTGGLETVAVRMPDHPVALRLIEAVGDPIAAPSANLSGRPSPTAAEHVLDDLGGRIEMILDAGPTSVGVESTVLDLTASPPVILRPGGVTLEQLERVLGGVRMTAEAERLRHSPGTRYRHYSPRARMLLIEAWDEATHPKLLEAALRDVTTVGYIGSDRDFVGPGRIVHRIILSPEAEIYARRIFAALRELDRRGVEVIVVEGVPEVGLGRAVMDRLRRAAEKIL